MAALAAAGMRGRAAVFRQEDGLLAAGPWAVLPADIRDAAARNMPAETVAAALPFTASGVNDGQGIVLGRDRDGGLVLVDLWARGGDRTNSNGVVLARPGAGKSFAVKLLLTRAWAQGARVIVIDPEREYGRLARALGGKVIDCAAGGINPLQARPLPKDPDTADQEHDEDLRELTAARAQGAVALHLQFLRTFFSLYLPGLGDLERAALRRALRQVYAEHGITPETDPAAVPAEAWPTVKDLHAWITHQVEVDREPWGRLAVLLEEAAEGADAALWAGPTTVRADADLVVLDVHDLQNADDAVRRAQYFNVLAWVWSEIERDRAERTLLVVDEAWLLVDPQTPQTLAFLRDTSKRIRKYEGGLWVISQNVVDFLAPAVTALDIIDYRGWLQRHKRKPKSINRALTVLKVFLGWCVREDLAHDNAAAGIKKVGEGGARPRWLPRKDQAAFVRAVQKYGNLRDRAIVALLLHAGIRVGELVQLEQGDIVVNENSGHVTVTGKGNKVREIPLNGTVRSMLREHLQKLPPGGKEVFPGRKGGKQLTARGVEHIVERYAHLAGLENVTPHTLRHCFVKNLIDAGVDLPSVAELAGHASLDTTRLYCLPGRHDLQRIVEKMSWE